MKINYPVGIIDIGSNSVRLMCTDGVFFSKTLITSRLGEGVSKENTLSKASIQRTVDAIVKLKETAYKNGAKKVYSFATAAVRQADNRQDFLNEVKMACGLIVDVVSGEDEAKLGAKGALFGGDGGIIDVGGASSEIAVCERDDLIYAKSLKVGAVTLYDKFNRNKSEINLYLKSKVKDYLNVPKTNFYAIGGTATSLATISLGLKVYDSSKTDGCILTYKKLKEIENKLYLLTPQEITENYAIDLKRAGVIAGGTSIILNIIEHLKIDSVTVSEKDNLEGYLKYLEENE